MKEVRKKFTLIELLVVIGLATMLMTIMLPAFNRMISGNAVDRAASELKLALEHAQSIAASSRKYVAVVFPNGTNWAQNKRLSSYRLCYVKLDTNSPVLGNVPATWNFVRWVPDKIWQKLDRCLIIAASASESNVKLPASGGLASALTSISGDLDYDFRDSGTSSISENRRAMKRIKSFTEGPTADSYCAVVFAPTGGVKSGGPVYLAIAEAAINGTNIVYPIQDGNNRPINFVSLRIDNLSGAVEYVK